MASHDARRWAPSADLFDNVLLSEVKPLTVGMILDLWLYEGRGESAELVQHATVVLNSNSVTIDNRHWSEMCGRS